MRTTSLALTISLLFAVSSFGQVNRDQARSLVRTALKLRGDSVSAKQIEETTNNVPGYYSFGAYDNRHQAVQNVVGWFAVNKTTGQVWDTTACELYQFPTLERQRHKIVKHTTKARQKPPCSDGQRTHIVRKRVSHRPAELPETAQ
jgi:hypothetical protein